MSFILKTAISAFASVLAKGILLFLATIDIRPELWVLQVLSWPATSQRAEAATWALVGLVGAATFAVLLLVDRRGKLLPPDVSPPDVAATHAPTVGEESVVVGNVPPGGVGARSVVYNLADERGNVILNRGGVAIGHGARADSTSIAIGAGANASVERGPPAAS